MVKIAIALLTLSCQGVCQEVSPVADDASSLLQGAYQTMAAKDTSMSEVVEKTEDELQKLDNVMDDFIHSKHPAEIKQDEEFEEDHDNNLDQMQLGNGEEHDEGLVDTERESLESETGHDMTNDMTDENGQQLDSSGEVFSQLQHLEKLHSESQDEGHESFNETQLAGLKPEAGDDMPNFPRSFPGCGCDYSEWNKKWTCRGSIAYPASMQGNECCCCTLGCLRRNRCTDEQCLLIGIDQKAEVAAEEARRAALLKDADALLGDLPAYKVSLGIGRPTGSKIMKACKDKDMTPLCDHQAYRNYGCYHPPSGHVVYNKHLSVVSSLKATGIDPMQFYGLAMYVNQNNSPYGGALFAKTTSHQWVSLGGNIDIYDIMGTGQKVQTIPIGEVDAGRALGGWHTYCVKEKPNPR